jgi:hypothetical protein
VNQYAFKNLSEEFLFSTPGTENKKALPEVRRALI